MNILIYIANILSICFTLYITIKYFKTKNILNDILSRNIDIDEEAFILRHEKTYFIGYRDHIRKIEHNKGWEARKEKIKPYNYKNKS